MNKNIIVGIAVVVAIGVGAYFFINAGNKESAPIQKQTFDGRNATFTVEGTSVTLMNGASQAPVEGSAAKVVTQYFGNEATGDLNGDGTEDMAFLVTQNNGGSGTFFYAVVALQTPTGYKTTNAFLVGDRIAPQSTEIHSDAMQLNVNYADRKKGEPMTAVPSQGSVLLLKVTPDGILEGLMK